MYMPDIPIKLWNVLGDDAIRFSYAPQPALGVSGLLWHVPLPLDTPVLRCGYEQRALDEDGTPSHPQLCGAVAYHAPEGPRCEWHRLGAKMGCAWCDETEAREQRACPGHHALWRDLGGTCWCCPEEETP